MLQRKGAYPPPPGASDLPGLEVSGEVVALGEGAARWRVGERSLRADRRRRLCRICLGARQQRAAAAGRVSPSPRLPPCPRPIFTVWHNVFERGGLKAGETLLVHGGSSGIGTTAIQLASAFGAYVITTAGSAEKCEACLKLGADRAINYKDEDFVAAVKEATDGKGADVILDMVGGDYVARNYEAAAVEGRIVQIATAAGGAVASTDFSKLMVKRLTHTGSTLRPRTVEFKGEIAAALEAKVWPLLASRSVRR